MGKFNEYTQKATPADNDTLMIYDAAAKANKLSPFSGIWNWIVGKLTNAVISNLQTSNKSVIGALNELNSNRQAGLSELVTIPANSMLKIDITFKKPFSKIPTVLCCIRSGSEMYKYGSVSAFVDFNSITTTGFTAKIANNSDVNVSPNVSWIAVI